MKEYRLLWWSIQVNAVLCFLLVGAVGPSDGVSYSVKVLSFSVLFSAAIVEYVAYKKIYKSD
jgi:hypothetical protein